MKAMECKVSPLREAKEVYITLANIIKICQRFGLHKFLSINRQTDRCKDASLIAISLSCLLEKGMLSNANFGGTLIPNSGTGYRDDYCALI